ncbi:collagen alpha-2(IX) chain-like [Frankliniella occidentalis]|uniref:Collagen alpha-2(IX) chain-like n=1 Tax=Frankliniella occidentalis TaxID=133901 RepID=A0A9C6X4A6_FRAOC|nr:collagen alpha-2(IX) chain-like [Frankliniella occidentalis]
MTLVRNSSKKRSLLGQDSDTVSVDPTWQPKTLNGEPNSKRLWANLRTSQLLDQAVIDGDSSAAATEATRLALINSFVTKYTCLAVDIVIPYTASTASDPPTVPVPSSTVSPSTSGPSGPPTGRPGPPSPTGQPGPPPPTGQPGPPSPTGRPGPPSPTGRPGPPGPPSPTGQPGPPSPTGQPGPPSPTGRPGPPGPPAPTTSPGGKGGQNIVSIGSVTIGNLSVNGPLIQFNMR